MTEQSSKNCTGSRAQQAVASKDILRNVSRNDQQSCIMSALVFGQGWKRCNLFAVRNVILLTSLWHMWIRELQYICQYITRISFMNILPECLKILIYLLLESVVAWHKFVSYWYDRAGTIDLSCFDDCLVHSLDWDCSCFVTWQHFHPLKA